MVTFTLILIRSSHGPEKITVDMLSIPSLHEMISSGGILYRVEDITHVVETGQIEVRAIS